MEDSILWLLTLALGANAIAYFSGFYKVGVPFTPAPVRFPVLLVSFLIYFGSSLLMPLLIKIILSFLKKTKLASEFSISVLSLTQCMILVTALILLGIFLKKRHLLKAVCKSSTTSSKESDFMLGASTWLFSFPLVVAVGHLVDVLITLLFGPITYEQSAVRFVKLAKQNPIALYSALASVVILAPLVEELLFRGVVQSFFRQFLGRVSTIAISSLIFAIFHFAPSQGMGNIPLMVSLFILGGFLGFLYERQNSLFASLGLHVTFNAINVTRILLETTS